MAKKKRVRKRSLSLIDRCGGDQEIAEVCEHYLTYHERWRGPKANELMAIDAALENYTVNELKLAIDGLHQCEWHSGKNDRAKPYQRIGLCFKEEAIDGYIEEAAKAINVAENKRRDEVDRIRKEVAEKKERQEMMGNGRHNLTEELRKAMRGSPQP